MSYLDFVQLVDKNRVKTIFELGSRDLTDAIKLLDYFQDSNVYSFECNPECLVECNKTLFLLDENKKKRLFLTDKEVSLTNGDVIFYPFDLQKYNAMGSSSMLKIDFSLRNKDDPDYNLPNPQKKAVVDGIRLDTFVETNSINAIDLLCIDLQGYELNAIKSLGNHLRNVKYIITECSVQSTYTDGATFAELSEYLRRFNFKYVCSNRFGYQYPDLSMKGFSEMDAFFINERIF